MFSLKHMLFLVISSGNLVKSDRLISSIGIGINIKQVLKSVLGNPLSSYQYQFEEY